MDPQYLDWYFVHLTCVLETDGDRFSVGRRAGTLSATRERGRPLAAISVVAGALRDLPFWPTRRQRIQRAGKEYTQGDRL
jgi:hypothetical protein